MRHHTRWTIEAITIEAAKYDSKIAFMTGCKSAYNACVTRHPGLMDVLFRSSRRVWTEESARQELYKFSTRREFMQQSQVAYKLARKLFPELLDEVLPRKNKAWDEGAIRRDAANYTSKSEYFYAATGGYAAALKYFPNLLDELFENKPRVSLNDTIYIWRAVGEYFNGNPVYKIGVTSSHLGEARVAYGAWCAGFKFELICCEAVQGKATDLEKKLLILGENPHYTGFDGCTEFRALSDSALYAAVSMICGAM